MGELIRLLHVEDDAAFGELVATFLEREDKRLDVNSVTDPEEALTALDGTDFDCIVSDYDMPGRNGIELLEEVRDTNPDVPFILFTGKGSEEIASEAISAGVSDYLQKEAGTSQFTVLANRISNVVSQYQIEQEIEQTQTYFSTILEHSSDYMLVVDETGKVEYVSPSVERIMGYEQANLEGRDAFRFIHPDDIETAREAFFDLLEDPSTDQTVEYRVQHQDGSWRWAEVRGRNLLDDPTVGGILVNVRDKTEIESSRRQLETTIDNLPGYIYRHANEPEFPLEFVKGDATSVTGYTPEELESEINIAAEVIHPDDRDQVWDDTVSALESADRYDLTYRITTKSGETRWVRDQGQLVSDPVRDRAYLEGFVSDVSDQRRQQEALRRSQELLEHTERLTAIGGWEVDRESGSQRWTDGTHRIHDLDPDGEFEPTLEDGIDFYHPDDRETIESAVRACLSEGEEYEVKCRLITAEDRVRWVRARGVPVRDDGEIVGARGAIQDVTDQTKRERELLRMREFFAEAERLGELGAWEFDRDGNVEWTAGTRRIHEVGEEYEPTLEDGLEFFHPEDRERVAAAVEAALEHQESYDLTARIVTANDTVKWVRTRGVPRDDGALVRGYIQNITDQYAASGTDVSGADGTDS